MAERKQRRWWRWVAVAVLLGAAAGGAWWYFQRSNAATLEYRTANVSRGDIVQTVTANGQLTPVVDVEVGSQVSGIIQEIFVDFNSRVTNGQVLARIEPSTFRASVQQAEADVANARASLELAQVNARRSDELLKNKLIPVSDHDATVGALHQAEAVLQMREASLKRAQTDFERTTIYAPIDGIVIVRNVEMGQTVAASFNTPKLFEIANDLTKMEIDAAVSEADVGGVEEGQKVNFTVDAFPTRQFQGVVKQVRFAPSTNQNVVTYTTVVEVNNTDLKLRPGMTANASIVTAERKDVLRLPNAAFRFRPPEGAIVSSNAPAGSTGTGAVAKASAPVSTSGPYAGLPEPPWQAEQRRPAPEEREKYEASLTPEQREQYRQIRDRMRARFAEGGGAGRGGERSGAAGASARPAQEGPRPQTVYTLDQGGTGNGRAPSVLKPVTVTAGITDGLYTELIDGLKAGDVVVTSVVRPETPGAATSRSPASGGSPFGGPFGPRRF